MTLNRLLTGVLAGGYLVLLLELRTEHQAVLAEMPIAWTPILYSGLMFLLCAGSLVIWNKVARRILFWCFALGLVVGVVGISEHNEENFAARMRFVADVWIQTPPPRQQENVNPEPGSDKRAQPDTERDRGTKGPDGERLRAPLIPPVFAPLTFLGLGLIGMLSNSRSLQCGEDT